MEPRLAFSIVGAALAAGYALSQLFYRQEIGIQKRLKWAGVSGFFATIGSAGAVAFL